MPFLLYITLKELVANRNKSSTLKFTLTLHLHSEDDLL